MIGKQGSKIRLHIQRLEETKIRNHWARACIRRFPSTLADLSKMDVVIKDGYAKITENLKLLNSVRKFAQIYYSCKEVSLSLNI